MFKTKIIRTVAVVFAVAFMVVAVAGCDNAADGADDSNISPHDSRIVGVWKYSPLENYETVYTFNPDGTGTVQSTLHPDPNTAYPIYWRTSLIKSTGEIYLRTGTTENPYNDLSGFYGFYNPSTDKITTEVFISGKLENRELVRVKS